LLFLLVAGAFAPCLWNGFVSLDDPNYISLNEHVRPGLTWEGLRWAWTSTEVQNWHPLTWMSHMLDTQLFGLEPAGHHATNVLLHAVNTVLLFLLLRKLTGARWRSFVVAALFGLHPLRVESVAWISERKDVLSTLFFLLTIWAYVRCVEERSGGVAEWWRIGKRKSECRNQASGIQHSSTPALHRAAATRFYSLALVLFALGLLAKPMLVTLPFVLLLLDYWPLGRWPQTPLRRLGLEKMPFLLLAAASSVATFIVQERGGAVTPTDTISMSARLANAAVSYVRYLGKTSWPVNLCAMYLHPGHWPAGTVAAAGLFLAVVTALVVWRWRTMPWLAVGWLWFLGTLVPVIGLVQVGRQALADRYTYLPSIGLLIAVVWGLDKLTQGWRRRENLARAFVGASVAACLVLTVRQIGYWRDTRTLYARAKAVTRGNWVMAALLAHELQREGNLDEAVAAYQESLAINPHRTEVRCSLADTLSEQRRFDEALAQFQKAAELDPADASAHQRWGGLLQNMGRLDQAIEQYTQAIRLRPDYADAYSNLGNCYGMAGRMDDAIRCLEQAVKLKPKLAQNHRELGVGLANLGRWDDAIDQFRQATQLDPSDAQAQSYLDLAMRNKARGAPPPPAEHKQNSP
jgi:tetratricopeptide (TPR) repeat protein